MATYSVKTARGTYSFDAPKGLPDNVVYATIAAGNPEAFAPLTNKPVGDFANYLKQGAVGSTQSITDVAGINNPASQWLERKKQGIQFSEAEQAKQKRAQEITDAAKGKGVVSEGLAALHAFGTNPKALTGQAIGSLAPFALPVAAAVAAPFAPEIAAAGFIAEGGSAAMGLAAGAGGMKRSMYDATKEALVDHGVDPKKAEEAAQKAASYTGPNAALIAGGGLVGIIDSVTGVGNKAANAIADRVAAKFAARTVGEEAGERVAGRIAGEAAGEAAKKEVKKGFIREVGLDALKETGTEAFENAYQQVGTNVAQANAGVPTSPWEGVAGEAVTGGLGGLLAGGAAGAALHGINTKTSQLLAITDEKRREAFARAIAAGAPKAKGAVTDADYEAAVAARAEELAAKQRGIQPFLLMETARDQIDAERAKAVASALGTTPGGRGKNRGGAAADAAATAAGAANPSRATTDVGGTEPVVRGDRGAGAADDAAKLAGAEAGGLELDTSATDEPAVGAEQSSAALTPKAQREQTLATAAVQVTANFPALVVEPGTKAKVPTLAETTAALKEFTTAHDMPFNVPGYLRDAVQAKVKASGGKLHPIQALSDVLDERGVKPLEVTEAASSTVEAPEVTPADKAADTLKASAESGKTVEQALDALKASEAPPGEAAPLTEAGAPPVDEAQSLQEAVSEPENPPETPPAPAEEVAPPAPPAPVEEAPPAPPIAEQPAPEAGVAPPEAPAPEPGVSEAAPAEEVAPPAPGEETPPAPGEEAPPAPGEEAPPVAEQPAPDPELVQAADDAVASAEKAHAAAVAVPGNRKVTPAQRKRIQDAETALNEARAMRETLFGEAASEAATTAELITTPQDTAANNHGKAQAAADLNGDEEPAAPDLPPQETPKPSVPRTVRKLNKVTSVQEEAVRNLAEEVGQGRETAATAKAAKAQMEDIEATDQVVNEEEPFASAALAAGGDTPTDEGVASFIMKAPMWLLKLWVKGANSSSLANLIRGALPKIDEIRYMDMMVRGYRSGLIEGFDEFGRHLKGFVNKYGDKEIGHAMRITRRYETDILTYDNAVDAIKNDPVIRKYEALIAAGVKKTKTGQNAAEYTKALATRKEEITSSFKARDALAAQEGGLEMYKDLLNFHSTIQQVMTTLRNRLVNAKGLKNPDEAQRLMDFIEKQMDPSAGRTRPGGMHSRYRMVQADALPKVYFPAKRYGPYWLSVKDPIAGRQFYMYDTHKELEEANDQLAKLYGVPKTSTIFQRGDNREKLQREMAGDSETLRKALSIVDNFEFTGATKEENDVQKQQLRDAIFQTQLHALPDRSLAKRLIHFEDVMGASHDVLRDFGSTTQQLASQLTLMRYGPEFTQLNSSLRELIRPTDGSEGQFSNRAQERLEMVVNTLMERLQISVTPPEPNKWVSRLNRFAVVMYMSSAASALANMTIMAVRVWPRLVRDHGMIAATRKAISYMNYMDKLKIEVKHTPGLLFPNITLPSMANTSYVRSNPNLKWAMEWGKRRALFHTAYDMQVDGRPSDRKNLAGIADDVSRVGTKALTVGLSATESISREHTFMMAFELQMAKERKAGRGTLDQQRERAAAYAAKSMDETVGNPSAFESPLFMQKGMGRVIGLFKRFSLQTINFFWGNSYSAAKALSKGDIKTFALATGEMGMVMGMTALFAGVTGLPLYSLITGFIDAWDKKFLTEEEKQARALKYGIAAPSLDMRLRLVDIPKFFGGATIPGVDGFQHSLSNVLVNGPIPELTDLSIGPRVSMDKLLWRGAQAGDDWGQVVNNTIAANVAGFAAPEMVAKGVEDMSNGEYIRGLEKMLPAGLKGFATAYRLGTEGSKTLNNKTMMAKEKFTEANLIGQVLGLPPTKLYTLQLTKRDIAAQVKQSGDMKTALLQQMKSAIADGDRERFMKVLVMMHRFNENFPYPGIAFTNETIQNSLEGSVRDAKASVAGTTMSRKNVRYTLPAVMASLPVAGGAPGQ